MVASQHGRASVRIFHELEARLDGEHENNTRYVEGVHEEINSCRVVGAQRSQSAAMIVTGFDCKAPETSTRTLSYKCAGETVTRSSAQPLILLIIHYDVVAACVAQVIGRSRTSGTQTRNVLCSGLLLVMFSPIRRRIRWTS